MNEDDMPTENPIRPPEQGQPVVSPGGKGLPSVKVTLLGIAVVAVLLFGGLWLFNRHSGAPGSGAGQATVQPAKIPPAEVGISAAGFTPATITIKPGQAVVWVNKDGKNHVVASDPYPTNSAVPGLNSRQPIPAKGSYSFVFNRLGTYTYHDNLHPKLLGTVIVSN